MFQKFKKLLSGFDKKPQDRIEKALNVPAPIRAVQSDPAQKFEYHASPAYNILRSTFRNVGRMNAIIETMGRDFLTAMPQGAYVSRLGQIAFFIP